MTNLQEVTQFLENRYENQIREHCSIPAATGEFAQFPDGLHPQLRRVLRDQGITNLYAHQARAFESVASGRDTVLVSSTASGKTLAFLLPVLNDYMTAESPFSTMLLYPTKALSRDQE